jgi:hypothetical protein
MGNFESMTLDQMIDGLMKERNRVSFIKELGDLTTVLISMNYPFLPTIADKIKNTPDGEINITLKTYKGKVQSALFHEITKVSYKKEV